MHVCVCACTQLCFIFKFSFREILNLQGSHVCNIKGVLSSGIWAPRETQFVLHNQSWSRKLLCTPASSHKNREHTKNQTLGSHTRWLLPSWPWVINNFIKNVLSTCLYLYMYLTRNHQDFRGKFLFPFLFIAQKRKKLRKKIKKNCLWLITGGLSMFIVPFLGPSRVSLGLRLIETAKCLESCGKLAAFHYAERS